jgi:hypothetical protein
MPKPNKQTIIDAIIKHLEQGTATEKICAAICSKFQFTERTFYNHFKVAQIQHVDKQQAIRDATAVIDTNAAIASRKRAIMAADDRKEYLTKLIMGEIKAKQPFVIGGKIMEYPSEPNHSDRIRAIAELNKMCGDYSPTKIANTDGSGNDISPIINIQVVNPIED